jgi:gamma-glutamyltranspeptidase/glutathione hydrolase
MRDFHQPGRSAVYAENGMCATSHPLAAKVAIDVLQSGGNAVDAAIAGSVLLGLCEPAMTGIGGDCFALVKPAGSEDVIALNGSGRAPAALTAAEIRAAGHMSMPLFGAPEPITIPGAVDAFCRLSEDHGRLGLDAVLAPVIHYAEAGVPVAPRAAFDWMNHDGNLSGRARDYYLVGGEAPAPGQLFRQPRSGRGAAQDRGAGPRRVLRGGGGRGHGRLASGHRRCPHARGFRRRPARTTPSRSAGTTRASNWSSIRRTGRGRRRSC